MAEISLKYGFLGLGMGGCSIANECAGIRMNVKNNMNPYTALLVNTNEMDMEKLINRPNAVKFLLKGYERGAGRDIRVGEEAFLKHREEISKQVRDIFADRDFLFVSCGLGGASGTGSVIEAIRLIHSIGFAGRFGLILTLPRDQEGHIVVENAIQRLQLIAKAMKGLGSIQIVDNQKLFQDYLTEFPQGNVTEFLEHSNRYVADTLHDLNVVTAKYTPFAGYHFDGSELLKAYQTPGILTYGKCVLEESKVDAANQGTYMPYLKQSIENGMLSTGYDLTDSVRCAVSMVASVSGARRIFTLSLFDAIEKQLADFAPYAGERPVSTYVDEGSRQLQMYSVFAGLGMPKRVSELVKFLQDRYARERKQDSALRDLQQYNSSRSEKESIDLDSLLNEESNPERVSKASDDPFDF